MNNNKPLTHSEAEELVKKNHDKLLTSVSDSLVMPPVQKKDEKWLKLSDKKSNTKIMLIAFLGLTIIAIGNLAPIFTDKLSGSIGLALHLSSIAVGLFVAIVGMRVVVKINLVHREFRESFKFDRTDIYKRFLKDQFQNLTIEKHSNGKSFDEDFDGGSYEEDKSFATKNKKIANHSPEKNVSFTPGIVGYVNNMKYIARITKTKQDSLTKLGAGINKKNIYNFDIRITDIAKRYENLNLELTLGSSRDKNVTDNKINFKNVAFNEIAVVQSNDEIATRHLLTPYAQEQLVRMYKDFPSTVSIKFKKGVLILAVIERNQLFGIEFTPNKNRKNIAENIAENILNSLEYDIITFISLMSYILAFETLKTG